MTITAILLFALAAVIGVVLAGKRLKERPLPTPLAIFHGLFAAVGLGLLIYSVIKSAETGLGLYSMFLFIIAALGGFVLISKDLRGKLLPLPLMFVHAAAAVVAFLLLLLWAFA